MTDRSPNPTAASLLGFLLDRPRAGSELVRHAEAVIGPFWTLTRSQVYRELAAMAEAGLVTAGEPGPRDRRRYTVTDDGRRAFEAWLEAGPGQESIRFPLLLTVVFGAHLAPGRRRSILADQRAVHAERLAAYRALAAAELDPWTAATVDFGRRYEAAILDWFDALPPQVTG